MKAEDFVHNFTTVPYTVNFGGVPRKIKQTTESLMECSIKKYNYLIIRSTKIMPNSQYIHIMPNYVCVIGISTYF